MMPRFVFVLALIVLAASASKSSDKIVSTAKGTVGKYRYCWGGGDDYGPTKGKVMSGNPTCDDTKNTGFDCSGLAKYCVFQGTGKSMTRVSRDQHAQCKNLVKIDDVLPGDLVFYRYDGVISHVAIYIGNNRMIEAPSHWPNCTGKFLCESNFRKTDLVSTACRMWEEDGSESEQSGQSEDEDTASSLGLSILVLSLVLLVSAFLL